MKNIHKIWERLIICINRITDIDKLLNSYQSNDEIDSFMQEQYIRHKQQYVAELMRILRKKNIVNPYQEIVEFAEKYALINELQLIIKYWKNYVFIKQSSVLDYAYSIIQLSTLHHQKEYLSLTISNKNYINFPLDYSETANYYGEKVIPKLINQYVG